MFGVFDTQEKQVLRLRSGWWGGRGCVGDAAAGWCRL